MTNKPESASLREKIEALTRYEWGHHRALMNPAPDGAFLERTSVLAAIEQGTAPVAYLMRDQICRLVLCGKTADGAFPVFTHPATDAAKDARIGGLEIVLALFKKDITELRKQLAAKDARIAELEAYNETRTVELAASVHQCAELRQQLAEQGARLAAAEDAFTKIAKWADEGRHEEDFSAICKLAKAAIASTGEKP